MIYKFIVILVMSLTSCYSLDLLYLKQSHQLFLPLEERIIDKLYKENDFQNFSKEIEKYQQLKCNYRMLSVALPTIFYRYATDFTGKNQKPLENLLERILKTKPLTTPFSDIDRWVGRTIGSYANLEIIKWLNNNKLLTPDILYHIFLGTIQEDYLKHALARIYHWHEDYRVKNPSAAKKLTVQYNFFKTLLMKQKSTLKQNSLWITIIQKRLLFANDLFTFYQPHTITTQQWEKILNSSLYHGGSRFFKTIYKKICNELNVQSIETLLIFACYMNESEIVHSLLLTYQGQLSAENLITALLACHNNSDGFKNSKLTDTLANSIDLSELTLAPISVAPSLNNFSAFYFLNKHNEIICLEYEKQKKRYRAKIHLSPVPFIPPYPIIIDRDEVASSIQLSLLRFTKPYLRYKNKLYYRATGKNEINTQKAYRLSGHTLYSDGRFLPLELFLELEEVNEENVEEPVLLEKQ